jgi:hypothetical protein
MNCKAKIAGTFYEGGGGCCMMIACFSILSFTQHMLEQIVLAFQSGTSCGASTFCANNWGRKRAHMRLAN